MAERTEEHEKLIEKAKGLEIKSPHLFGFEALQDKIAEVKGADGAGGITKDDIDDDAPDLGDGNNVILKEGNGWLYHETDQPRIFKDGDEVPEGWNIENRKLWKIKDDSGKFINVNG